MFKIKIKTDNEAFQDNPGEVARILVDIARLVRQGYEHGLCRDINGNEVGDWSF